MSSLNYYKKALVLKCDVLVWPRRFVTRCYFHQRLKGNSCFISWNVLLDSVKQDKDSQGFQSLLGARSSSRIIVTALETNAAAKMCLH